MCVYVYMCYVRTAYGCVHVCMFVCNGCVNVRMYFYFVCVCMPVCFVCVLM